MPMLSSGHITTIIILVCLILMSAFFSASETAISSANRVRIKVLADDGKKSARKLMGLIDKYDKTISTILIGNNLVNIAIATLAVGLLEQFITNPSTADIVSTLSTTIVVLIFGEIFPKTLAKEHPEGFALTIVYVIYVLSKIFSPLTYLFTLLKKVLIKDGNVENSEIPNDDEELGMILDSMQEKGIINEEENDFIHCVLTLNDKSVSDIMVPRVDMIMINVEDTNEEIKEIFFESKFSRIPVYDEDKDDIIGILYERDFLTELIKDSTCDIRSILRQTKFVPRTLKVDNLIKELKATKTHIAIVVDEYGGTAGLVTMEDALEEIVGEIYDEHDEKEKKLITSITENEYLIDLDLDLSELFEELDLGKTPETEFYKVGGWLLELSEEFPNEDDEIEYISKYSYYDDEEEEYVSVCKKLTFIVSKIQDRRLLEAILKIEDVEEDEEKEE